MSKANLNIRCGSSTEFSIAADRIEHESPFPGCATVSFWTNTYYVSPDAKIVLTDEPHICFAVKLPQAEDVE